MYRNPILFLAIFLISFPCSAQDISYAKKTINTLTDKTYWGRGYTKNGMAKAANFIEKEFRKIGLAPVNQAGYQQHFSFAVNTFPGKMDLEINFASRADSNVAVHFHEHGDCGNMGENTHGHWNPTNEPHGKWDSDSFHSGDIGNIALDGKGRAKISLSTTRWSVADGI